MASLTPYITLPPLLAPGEIVDQKYRVLGMLGGGGTGEVFDARHLELGLRVAIKVLRRSDGHAAMRFLAEAQACARLKNDHIPRVFDIGKLPNGAPYIVMEYLVGEDLGKRIARGPVEPDEAVAYVVQACAALAEAHAAGVVHRDLKPANLFLVSQQDGPPLLKVLDFGVSKWDLEALSERRPPVAAATGITHAGSIGGSPEYMSPEQLRSNRSVDARGDIWSLGVVLFELIAGRPPFCAETFAALAEMIAEQAAPSFLQFRAGVPQGLEDVVSKCLEKEPARRFDSAEDLARALAPFASLDHAVLVPPTILQIDRRPPATGSFDTTARRAWALFGRSDRRGDESTKPRRRVRSSVMIAGGLSVVLAALVPSIRNAFIDVARVLVGSSPIANGKGRARAEAPAVAPPSDQDLCAGHGVVAEGTDPLIDDIEDGDIAIRPVDHRQGEWSVYSGPGCTMTPLLPHPAPPGGVNPSHSAMHVGAQDCVYVGFGLLLALNRRTRSCAYDASVYDGVYFWARSGLGPVSAHFRVGTRAVQPMSFGGDGTCEPKCFDAHLMSIELTPTWKQYEVRWGDLRQRGHGTEAAFDPKQITTLALATLATPREFREIWIDQIGFFKSAPPRSPFPEMEVPR